MIDYAERGALLHVEGLLTNHIHPDRALSIVVRIVGDDWIGKRWVSLRYEGLDRTVWEPAGEVGRAEAVRFLE